MHRTVTSRDALLAALLFLTACEGAISGAAPDAGSATCPTCDAATPTTDAGPMMGDAGGMSDDDAGMADPPDAAPPPDAWMPDAGPPPPSSTRHTARPLGTTDAANGFYEYLPPGYGEAPSPLLVFWHGVGENGNGTTELDRVLRNGPPRLIERDEWPADRPFVVLSAQHAGGGCPSANEIHDFLTFAMAEYDVDLDRVYLTGLSCGAIGSWNYLGTYLDEQITALVAIAGDGRGAWSRSMCDLGRVAIWAFHGDADGTVSPQGTIVPTTNLAECAAPRRDLEVTIYPGVGHDSWSRTYNLSAGHDIYAWLLTQHR